MRPGRDPSTTRGLLLLPSRGRKLQRRDGLASVGMADQNAEAALARRRLLGAHHVEGAGPLVPGRRRREETPGRGTGAESPQELRRQDARPALVGVRALHSRLEGGESSRGDSAVRLELAEAPEVDRAPLALRLARAEADAEARRVEGAPYAVDPAQAQRLVEGLAVAEASAPG